MPDLTSINVRAPLAISTIVEYSVTMRNRRRLSVQLHRDHAIEATRIAVGRRKLVYVLVADKTLRYASGKSRVVYIGTTQNGASRVA